MKAQEAGKIVVLASGRPTAGVEPLAKELELARFGSYILSYNGGMIKMCIRDRSSGDSRGKCGSFGKWGAKKRIRRI